MEISPQDIGFIFRVSLASAGSVFLACFLYFAISKAIDALDSKIDRDLK